MRAVTYYRISLDRKHEGAGVERQRKDCLARCKREGWTVVEELEDNDQSAYGDKHRKQYNRLIELVAQGAVDVVVAYHADRLWRDPDQQRAFLGFAKQGGLSLVATTSGRTYNPADVDDSLWLSLETLFAHKESADKARRLKRAQVAKAERGEWIGGPRSYGYESDGRQGLRQVPSEARIVRELARRTLAGESSRSLVIDLNRRGILTAKGKPWWVGSIPDLLESRRLAGILEYDGQQYDAKWTPILDMETHLQLRALFAARKRGPIGTRSGPRVRKYLLTGLLVCSKCGSGMGMNTGHTNGNTTYRYICKAPGSGGCAGTTIRAGSVETVVLDRLVEYLNGSDFARAMQRARKAAARDRTDVARAMESLERDRAQRTQLGDDYADGILDRGEYQRLVARLDQRIDETAKVVDRAAGTPSAERLAGQGDAIREAWDAMHVVERREVLESLVATIVVLPATSPVNVFRPERIRIEWRFD